MGQVVVIMPIADVLEFEGRARGKAEALLAQMIEALRRLRHAKHGVDIYKANEQIKHLQEEYYRARATLEWLSEVFDAANAQRHQLWSSLQEGKSSQLVATSSDEQRVIVMQVHRKVARIASTDFELFERFEGKLTRTI